MNALLSLLTAFRRRLADWQCIATWLTRELAVTATWEPIGSAKLSPVSPSGTSGLWLQIKFSEGLPVGKWIAISYSASIYDEVVRPALLFKTPGADRVELLPVPLFGSNTWIGHVPTDTIGIYISPSECDRQCNFRVDALKVLPAGWPFALALAKNPKQAVGAVLAICLGSPSQARDLLRDAIRGNPLKSYDRWRRCRLRTMEPDGLDRRPQWRRNGPHIRVVLDLRDPVSETSIATTLGTLIRQDYQDWSIGILASDTSWPGMGAAAVAGSKINTIHIRPSVKAEAIWSELADDALIAPLASGGMLPPY